MRSGDVDESKAANRKIYQFREDSDEGVLDRGYEENEINSLKLKNFADDEFYQLDGQETQYNGDDEIKYKLYGGKRKKEKRKKRRSEENRQPSLNSRKIVNMPASQPYIRFVDGEERLFFKYNTKVSEAALNEMPKVDLEENEFCIRFDIENVDISKLNEKFKADNCVYPRANVPLEMYTGNRLKFETECNQLGWKLVSLNPRLLYGKKGLIQRGADSVRSINEQSRNKRSARENRFPGDFEKRRHSFGAPSTVTIKWISRGIPKKCKIQVNVDNINYDKIDEDFKFKFSVFMNDLNDKSFGLGRLENRNADDELAVKIALANIENPSFLSAMKALDKTTVLRKAIEAYKKGRDEYISSEDDTEISDIIADTLGDKL